MMKNPCIGMDIGNMMEELMVLEEMLDGGLTEVQQRITFLREAIQLAYADLV